MADGVNLKPNLMKLSQLTKLGVCALGLATASYSLAASPWSVRLRATYLETVDKSPAFSALGINFAENAVVITDKFIPEIDVAYAISDVLSAELVLTIPQKHGVDLTGAGHLGSFRHLPPTLLLQYHPNMGEDFRPYVGMGVNFTLIYDDELSVAGVPLSLENYSAGLALQAGFDVRIDQNWYFNVDVKRAAIRSDVTAGGAKLTTAKLDPWLWALGVRYEF